ncbi:MAG: toprim domain-containing protein, partial [Pseudomonadota bacterium]
MEVIRGLDLRLQTFYPDKRGGLSPCRVPERVAIPILDPKGNLKNIRLYQPRPKEGEAKILSWGRGFGSARLFPPVPPEQSDEAVILCEGESDTLCALSRGLSAITQTSKTKAWKERDLRHFAGLDVVVAYDADGPGVNYADWAAAALHQVAARVRVLEWPDWMGRLEDGSWPEKHGQDLTDFFVKHGKDVPEFMELVEGARVWEPPGG